MSEASMDKRYLSGLMAHVVEREIEAGEVDELDMIAKLDGVDSSKRPCNCPARVCRQRENFVDIKYIRDAHSMGEISRPRPIAILVVTSDSEHRYSP